MNKFVGYIDSPVGLIEIEASSEALFSLTFIEEKRKEESTNGIVENTKKQLEEYFEGKRKNFELPMEMIGTEFQMEVWTSLEKIPYAVTVSYKDICIDIDRPKASRAVGAANRVNKLPIIIPCHRVIGANGTLTGYAGGLERKEWLLNHEKKFSDN